MGFLMHDIVAGLLEPRQGGVMEQPRDLWAVFYVMFVGINIIGIEATMRFTVFITILALGILSFFYISVIRHG